MKVYLAGKIAKNDWRHELVPGLRDTYTDYNNWNSTNEWVTRSMYREGYIYVGPYFVGCDHGCAHANYDDFTPNHAWNGACSGWETDQDQTAKLCREAILSCDALFAWMDDGHTAYGTLVEIGIAFALGKTVVLASSSKPDPNLWFAYEHAKWAFTSNDSSDHHWTPFEAFNEWANISDYESGISRAINKCESPLEYEFFNAYLRATPTEMRGLVVQHTVNVNGKNYRLDFALPEKKIAFEMDGYTYHGKDRAHFNRDRRRDIDLKLAGWEVHRFDGDLIRDDPDHVVQIAAKLAGTSTQLTKREALRRLSGAERAVLKTELGAAPLV